MKIPQISIFVSNRPGRLHAVCQSLADADINLLSLTLADNGEFGLIRIIVSHPEKAVEILSKAGIVATVTEVLACEVSALKGGLAKLLNTPAGTLQIDYMYAYPTCNDKDIAVMILRFREPDEAIMLLQKAGVKILGRKDLLEE
ncbi:MAG TPA: amino acid-binding protein [Fibrobacter sp.]|nr:amino acid-binding protein [Fibrobacter sp.]